MSSAAQYLLALYICEYRHDSPVRTGTIADRLDRTPASATEMMKDLAADGLVEYEPYKGAALTPSGRDRAAELHETYVALSWFFRGVLELDDYERQALEIAGMLSPASPSGSSSRCWPPVTSNATHRRADRNRGTGRANSGRSRTPQPGGPVQNQFRYLRGFIDVFVRRSRDQMVRLLRQSFAAKLVVGFALTTGAVVGYGLVTRNVVGTILMATAGQVVLGAYLGTNTVVSMRTLEEQTEAIADGDMDVRVRTSRVDELGRVYSSVDRMRRSLASRVADADEARADAEAAEERAQSLAADYQRTATDYAETMRAVADGDLRRRVDVDHEHDAMETVGEAFNDAVDELETALARVESFATGVADGATDVRAAAEQIDDRTDDVLAATDDIDAATDEQRATAREGPPRRATSPRPPRRWRPRPPPSSRRPTRPPTPRRRREPPPGRRSRPWRASTGRWPTPSTGSRRSTTRRPTSRRPRS
ncbi:HAMP domain-containing protein [Halobaculum litoreum]|uniref:HAMP domain-containing protein n=1 Tax=Halobaculum litoreum TaxID=3031998 RepID=A0ABD5Y0Z9_9EURY